MDKKTEKALAKLLQGGFSANPAHKAALKSRLLDGKMELDLDDLGKVTGGVAQDYMKLKEWPE